jgi:hypothetical protein
MPRIVVVTRYSVAMALSLGARIGSRRPRHRAPKGSWRAAAADGERALESGATRKRRGPRGARNPRR